MRHRFFFLVITVWISTSVGFSENLPSSSSNQEGHLDRNENKLNTNGDKKLKEVFLKKLSEEYDSSGSFEEQNNFNDLTFRDKYFPLEKPDQDTSNDYNLEVDYSQEDSPENNFSQDYEMEDGYSVQDSPRQDVSNPQKNIYASPENLFDLKISSARWFYFLLKIPLIIIPSPCLTKCESHEKRKPLSQLSPQQPSLMPPTPSSLQQYNALPKITTTTRRPQLEIPETKGNIILKSVDSIDIEIIVKSLIEIHKIRDNILYLFGCLLQRPIDFLSEPQYTSLYILFMELRNKPYIMQFMVSSLKKIPKSDLNSQLKIIMKIFSQALSPQINCHAKFWVKELQERKVDFKSLSNNTCPDNFNILQGIKADNIKLNEVMELIDPKTMKTEYIIGPILSKILRDVQKFKVVLSQELFGIILANFPLITYNPVLDENIRFIFKTTEEDQIDIWEEMNLQPVTGTPFVFIDNIITQILIFPNVSYSIKEALSYIRINLKPAQVTQINPDYQVMHKIHKGKPDIKFLLSFIVPGVFHKEAVCLKNRLLRDIEQGRIRDEWMITERDGLRYTNPHDLLLGFLARLRKIIPNQFDDVAKTVTALLSALLIDKQNKQFSPAVQNIDIFTLLGYLSNPDFEPNVIEIYNKAINTLVSKPNLQIALSKLIPVKPGQCFVFDVCLKEVLKKIDQSKMTLHQVKKFINELKQAIPIQPIYLHCKDSSVMTDPIPTETITTRPSSIQYQQRRKPPIQDTRVDKIAQNSSKYTYSGNNHLILKNADLVNVLVLPPMLQANKDITIYINKKGAPVVDNPTKKGIPGNAKVTMPSLIVILKPPEINDPFGSMNPSFKTQILEPLIKIAGSSELTLILKNNVTELIKSGQCPTTAALIVTLLQRAKSNPLVQFNHQLLNSIKTFLSGLDLFAVVALPVVLKVAKIYPNNGTLYSMISITEPHKSTISVTPPTNVPHEMLVFAIVDTNKLKEPVDPQDPYGGLLPDIKNNAIGGVFIQQLRNIFTRIAQLLPNFKPKGYYNKGFLLMVLLQKLPSVPEIASNPHLKKIIIGYIWAITIPAFYTKISYDKVLEVIANQPKVKPDTSSLFELLPPPENKQEEQFSNAMKKLLEREDLFEILIIPKPTASTSRLNLLKMIIIGVMKSKDKFDNLTVKACMFYNSEIIDRKKGSLLLEWEIREIQKNKLKVQLGQLIENVLPYEELSNKNKKAYNNLMEYLKENSKIFSQIGDFPFKKYKTQGEFVIGLFMFLENNSIISQAAGNNIKALLPHVLLNGPGAKLIKNPRESSGRRSTSKLEIVF